MREAATPASQAPVGPFHVLPTRDGRWEVRDSGRAAAVRAFNDRDDAGAYADGLAFGPVMSAARTQRS